MKKRKLFTTLLTLTTALSFQAQADNFTLNSNTILNLTNIPSIYTCDNINISPPLNWSGAPKQTVSFALILSDPDAPNGTFYHWVVFNIPKNINGLNENAITLSKPIMVGKNTWNKNAYNGPCPPKGSTHHYIFSLYALDLSLQLTTDATADAVLSAIKNHVLDETELKATFGH